MKILATIEARMSSTRLPGKVLKQLSGKPMLQWLIERVRPSSMVDEFIVASSIEESDDAIERLCDSLGVLCCRGSLEDVLGRLTVCCEKNNGDLIVKLSGDNPLYHYELIDEIVKNFLSSEYDFMGTTFMSFSSTWNVERTFPLGLGVGVFPAWLLNEINLKAIKPEERESVVMHIIDNPDIYNLGAFQAVGRYSFLNRPELRFTVDTSLDFDLMEKVFNTLSVKNALFSLEEVIAFLDSSPEVRDMNRTVMQRGVKR